MVVYLNNIANNYYLKNQFFGIDKENIYFLVAYFLPLCMYQLAEHVLYIILTKMSFVCW